MHIDYISINGIKIIDSFRWNMLSSINLSGWHVILGTNGSGKTSIIRGTALCLIGPNDAIYLRQTWEDWVNKYCDISNVVLSIRPHNIDYLPNDKNNSKLHPSIRFSRIGNRPYKPIENPNPHKNIIELKHNMSDNPDWEIPGSDYIWGNLSGWFSASFGPYRRFTGGDFNYNGAYLQNPKAAPHISLFGEDAILSGALNWLKDMSRAKIADSKEIIKLLLSIINNESFLPYNTIIHEINEDEILIKDSKENIIDINLLGDGYKSALSIIICLIHQLYYAFGIDILIDPDHPNKITIPGVVLIDEVDAHLHPTWQQSIGFWLTAHFPNMQFIVTTHSPLICQAATTVYKLPTPGTNEEGRFLDDLELARLKYGNIFEAYASEAFGKIDRSEEGKKKLDRLADLTRFSWERDLTEDERREQAQLRAIFIDSPIGI